MTTKDFVIGKYPRAYATYGAKLFSKSLFWRIEDGYVTPIVNGASSESDAWRKAKTFISTTNKDENE